MGIDLWRKMDSASIESVLKRYIYISHPRIVAALRIQDEVLKAIREFLRKEGYVEVLAPIIGPVTDPGIRGARQVSIEYYGARFKLMSSMILYKQMAVSSLGKIFSLSPNIRMEPEETIKTGRHLTEFRQVDVEAANVSYEEAMNLAERMLNHVINEVKAEKRRELKELNRELRTPKIPYKRLTHKEAIDLARSMGFKASYEEEVPWDAEEALSSKFSEPFFIKNYPITARGFYYSEHPDKPRTLKDFDLLCPEGYGELISGGEREYRYEKVVERMKMGGEDPKNYGWYLEMLKKGIPPSAGFGIGVERLTRYICGLRKIWEAVPFPKVAGIISP